jgi:NAD(P) transhydrogenase subunit alpha
MKIAVPKERAPGERRVSLVPDVVAKLVAAGHTIAVERGAGSAAFYPDEAYANAGASLADGNAVYDGAEIVARVALDRRGVAERRQQPD